MALSLPLVIILFSVPPSNVVSHFPCVCEPIFFFVFSVFIRRFFLPFWSSVLWTNQQQWMGNPKTSIHFRFFIVNGGHFFLLWLDLFLCRWIFPVFFPALFDIVRCIFIGNAFGSFRGKGKMGAGGTLFPLAFCDGFLAIVYFRFRSTKGGRAEIRGHWHMQIFSTWLHFSPFWFPAFVSVCLCVVNRIEWN